MTPDEWQRVMNVNIGSVMNFMSSCHPIYGTSPPRTHHKYFLCMGAMSVPLVRLSTLQARGAINSFTKALAKELAPSNIQVNAIAFWCN